ncbi:hypothetical protein JAAARDRAFT_145694 [Jaapia argillacea MUCL 33604]|uniref:Uncharacterized protein n=1 Tax=Jaapia argillacea MUCL 33604 TaxID=933084 RepID=A0A067QES2_9AGAM|nr:hypothetical protein JAAARDRAFT_145694 [Jaapia argillacea MUCL 33604]
MTSLFPAPAPSLPDSTTALIKGCYPTSSPIHLCISHLRSRPQGKALLFTPSRPAFPAGLKEFDDAWLASCGGHGRISGLTARVKVLYPPSPAHLALVLSMLHVSKETENYPLIACEEAPSLVVLHEISSYFLPADPSHTISSYLSLVAHALAAVNMMNATRPGTSLVLFDSRIDELKLPVIEPVFRRLNFENGDEDTPDPPVRKESVSFLVAKYFEWCGTVENASSANATRSDSLDAETGGVEKRTRLRLVHTAGRSEDILWEWAEKAGPARPSTERLGIEFDWTPAIQ